jgi:hypothetical protein
VFEHPYLMVAEVVEEVQGKEGVWLVALDHGGDPATRVEVPAGKMKRLPPSAPPKPSAA